MVRETRSFNRSELLVELILMAWWSRIDTDVNKDFTHSGLNQVRFRNTWVWAPEPKQAWSLALGTFGEDCRVTHAPNLVITDQKVGRCDEGAVRRHRIRYRSRCDSTVYGQPNESKLWDSACACRTKNIEDWCDEGRDGEHGWLWFLRAIEKPHCFWGAFGWFGISGGFNKVLEMISMMRCSDMWSAEVPEIAWEKDEM